MYRLPQAMQETEMEMGMEMAVMAVMAQRWTVATRRMIC